MKGLIIVAALMASVSARPQSRYGAPTGSYLPNLSTNNFAVSNSVRGNFGSNQGSYSSQLNSGSLSSHTSSNSYQQQNQVQKHIYFYESPQDIEASQIRIRLQSSIPQKSYKIIFIKAPAYQAPQIQQIGGGSAQNEEKTVVYVLVKKPEEGQDIVIPASAASAKPSKPEVYFIKYKTQKEAEEQIQSIQAGSNSGVSAHSVSSGSELVSSIRDSQSESSSSQSGGISSQLFEGGLSAQSHSSQQQSNNYGPAGASGPY